MRSTWGPGPQGGDFPDFWPFSGFWAGFGGFWAFQGVPGGRGFILTKFVVKRRHLDLVQAGIDDFGQFFGLHCCIFGGNVAYSGAMLHIMGH